MKDHPTHLFPRLVEAHKLLARQQPVVLTNPFPHGKNMTQGSSSANVGSLGPPTSSNNPLVANVYMMKGDSYIETRAHDYIMLESAKKGKESTKPPIPLQIERMMGEIMTQILKGAFKKASHNPNARATKNYSLVEDSSQTPCVMYSLEVL
jgi:hypothetical protein